MNCYELIKSNENLLRILKDNQISANDIDNLQIYEEFRAMKKQNHKTVYCVCVLADKYRKSQRTIYNIVDHFRTTVSI